MARFGSDRSRPGIALRSDPLPAQAATQGQWQTLSGETPINPVHVAVMNTGEVLIVAGSGNDPNQTKFQAAVWNPVSQTFQTQTLAWDMFCNGMVTLPDGRVFINGGNLQYDPFFGERKSAVFDPSTSAFTDVENMANGRWYPTVTTLGNGRIMTFSGLDDTGATNSTVEIYTVGTGWSAPSPRRLDAAPLPAHAPEHRWSRLLCGIGRGSRFFNPLTNRWTAVVDNTNHFLDRTYGTSVLLPLTPAEWIQAACDDPWRRQPINRDDRNHRSLRAHPAVAVRARRCPSGASR